MTDRERILTHIIQIMVLHNDEIEHSYFGRKKEFEVGNVLIARPNFNPHNWTVSFYDHYDEEKDCYVVKDIVTGKLCNYYNESFVEIKTEWLSKYELLVGKKFKVYLYCKEYGTGDARFHSLTFDDENNTFTFKNRLPFHQKSYMSITLSMDLSLKEIRKELESRNSWIEESKGE
jgi:hypothetical protein